MTNEIKYVVAIDIGTSYSGYAYNNNIENERDPLSMTINRWQGGSNLSMKTPTIILFDKEKNFHSFGSNAEAAYADALQKGQGDFFICVKGFKMTLYHEKKVSNSLLLKDTDGRDINTMMVFTESIKSLKKDAMADMQKGLGHVNEDKVSFVLTVPAIWRESAKQFMRIAAEKAGIKSERLTIALESEVAALYCKNLELWSALGSGDEFVKSCFRPGGKYMIMDLGGGTVDTVVHAIDESGDVIELHKSSGGPWGGEYVNVNFRSFIKTTYGEDAARKFKETRPWDDFELDQDFERKKRDLNTENEARIGMKIPNHLKMLANKPIERNTLDHMYIEKAEFKSFFDPLIKEIIHHLGNVFDEIGKVPLIFLVGGFSESAYVQKKLREGFTSTRVIVPQNSGLAVLKGAVLFGFNSATVKFRRCRFTYGIKINSPFDETYHPPEKLIIKDGKRFCGDIFEIVVHESEYIEFDQVKEICLQSTHESKERKNIDITVPVYSSTRKNPMYVSDMGCSKLGEIKVKPPKSGWPDLNEYTVKCKFGRTEIFMNVHDTTNDRKYDATFDMLG